jgi:hypothetical protein
MVDNHQAKLFIMSKMIPLSFGIYSKAISAANDNINRQLKDFDIRLKIEWPLLYNCLDVKSLSRYSNYKLIHVWREKGYPSNIALPTIEKLKIAVRSRLSQIFHV